MPSPLGLRNQKNQHAHVKPRLFSKELNEINRGFGLSCSDGWMVRVPDGTRERPRWADTDPHIWTAFPSCGSL